MKFQSVKIYLSLQIFMILIFASLTSPFKIENKIRKNINIKDKMINGNGLVSSHNFIEISHLTSDDENNLDALNLNDIDNTLDYHSFIELNYLVMDL
jgi:hypothetical protein